MEKDRLQEVLINGISGTPETLPEERKLFLSTISERVYIALTNKQVIHRGMYHEVTELMSTKKKQGLHLYLNGQLSYSLYSNYVKEAVKNHIPFTVVNDGYDTPIGLVLASSSAYSSKEYNFFIEDEYFKRDMESK